ncbi:phosphatases II [Xylaria arbuscula]|nr:phosphatases II [Xylaria arbuscula]
MESAPLIYRSARPALPYTREALSHPPILTPQHPRYHYSMPMKVLPSYDNVDPLSLSKEDLAIITQNGLAQIAQDSANQWTYESRRAAQPVLDYLYLGPSTVARDRQWLRDQGITMILAARDAKQAGLNLMVYDKLAQELGIEAHYIDIASYSDLFSAFPSAIRIINDHMLRIYREQAVMTTKINAHTGDMVIDEASFRRGKILVYCETGNERSAGIVSAYLMAVLGMSTADVCQFITFKRFCVCMDEDLKRTLRSYEDILLAQRTVHQHEIAANAVFTGKRTKRGIEETVDDDGDDGMTGMHQYQSSDRDRFVGREFTPFIDD